MKDPTIPTRAARTFADVYAETVVNGGGTFDVATLDAVAFDTGYIVGIGNIATLCALTPAALAEVIDRARVSGITGLFGTWVDESDGTATVYVDRVAYTPFDTVARELQSIGNELCVWDCSARAAVNLLEG
jgi:hypothetical protein